MQTGWMQWGLGAAFIATGWATGAAHAQEAGASSLSLPTRIEPCKLVDGPPDRMGKAQIAVGCGRFGVALGSGDGVQAQADPKSGAIVVKLMRFGTSRVFIVTPRIGARPMLEEITGDLAFAMGRRVDRGIGDASVDLTRFASNREIRVTAGEGGADATPKSTSVALSEHVARASRVAAAPPAGTEITPGPAGN